MLSSLMHSIYQLWLVRTRQIPQTLLTPATRDQSLLTCAYELLLINKKHFGLIVFSLSAKVQNATQTDVTGLSWFKVGAHSNTSIDDIC